MKPYECVFHLRSCQRLPFEGPNNKPLVFPLQDSTPRSREIYAKAQSTLRAPRSKLPGWRRSVLPHPPSAIHCNYFQFGLSRNDCSDGEFMQPTNYRSQLFGSASS